MVALERESISAAIAWREAIDDHFSAPPVATDQAVHASGLYAVTGGKPESPRPNLEAGLLGDPVHRSEIVERERTDIQ
jgi:hypothetical protein